MANTTSLERLNRSVIWYSITFIPIMYAIIIYVLSETNENAELSPLDNQLLFDLLPVYTLIGLGIAILVARLFSRQITDPYNTDFSRTILILALIESIAIIVLVESFLKIQNGIDLSLEYILILLPIPFSFYYSLSWSRRR